MHFDTNITNDNRQTPCDIVKHLGNHGVVSYFSWLSSADNMVDTCTSVTGTASAVNDAGNVVSDV